MQQFCTDGEIATHYYLTAGGYHRYLCARCEAGFGYPQYLVQITPDPWRTEYGYLINAFDGSGLGDQVADVWPFEGNQAEEWLAVLGCDDKYLLADAAWEPYRAHQSVQLLTYEATRVTVLPLVQV
ncbi:hypothetical protein [Streptomyces sp. NPDC046805]|uniref:hypothetical protein n=1 Tax=Streptomyces sp. NPDC046805 TaxID=3155134 RepID=UPI0034022946